MSTEEQRDAFKAQLTEAEDWLYMEGAESGADEFKAKLGELQKVGQAMEKRASERTRRPEAVAKARAFAELTRKVVAAWNASKPHINETEKEGLLAKADELVAWLDEVEAKQAGRAAHEEPAFFAQEVLKELKARRIPIPCDARHGFSMFARASSLLHAWKLVGRFPGAMAAKG